MHKGYLYRDIWKGIETCQHQKAKQHFLACESEQEHSCQIWSSTGNKSFLPIFTLFTKLIHTETSLFTASILVFSGMNGDPSFSEWVYTGWKRKSLGHEPAQAIVVPSTDTFKGMGVTSSTQPACLHLHGPTLLTLKEGQRDAGTEEKENTDSAALFSYTEDKSPLAVCYCKTAPLQPASLRSGNVALAPTLLPDLKKCIRIPAAELRKWFSFKA